MIRAEHHNRLLLESDHLFRLAPRIDPIYLLQLQRATNLHEAVLADRYHKVVTILRQECNIDNFVFVDVEMLQVNVIQ